jgi:hypothetical protein
MTNFAKLPTWADRQRVYTVVETPRGSRAKLEFDPKLGAFTLKPRRRLGDEAPVVGIRQAEHQRLGQNEGLETRDRMSASPVLRVAFRPPRGRAYPRPKRVTSRDLASQCETGYCRPTGAPRCIAGSRPRARLRAAGPGDSSWRPACGKRGGSSPAQRVLHAADGVADFPADLVGLSFAFEFLVAGRLPATSLILPLAC